MNTQLVRIFLLIPGLEMISSTEHRQNTKPKIETTLILRQTDMFTENDAFD